MKPASAQDIRRRELAQIHIAMQDLGMTDDDHRSLLWSVCQVKSAADLDWTGRKRYLDHLKKLGFKAKQNTHIDRRLDTSPQMQKARAIWLMLHKIGVVKDPSESSLVS